MRASLATREDRGVAEEDNWTDIKQHVELLQIFIEHELNKSKVVCVQLLEPASPSRGRVRSSRTTGRSDESNSLV